MIRFCVSISKTITVMSSALKGLTKSIRNVVVHQVPLEFSKEITSMVHGLDVLQNFSTIQDINYSAFLAYAEQLAKNFNACAFTEIVSAKTYKKSTISFLREILNYHKVENNLDEYLSSLSEYKHPKMEELYETNDR